MENFAEIIEKWRDYDKLVAMEKNGHGTVMVELSNDEDKSNEGFIYSLYVEENHRRQGLAGRLLARAEQYIKQNDRSIAALVWDKRDSPYWVLDWYVRNGYEEKEFGRDSALLKKKLI